MPWDVQSELGVLDKEYKTPMKPVIRSLYPQIAAIFPEQPFPPAGTPGDKTIRLTTAAGVTNC